MDKYIYVKIISYLQTTNSHSKIISYLQTANFHDEIISIRAAVALSRVCKAAYQASKISNVFAELTKYKTDDLHIHIVLKYIDNYNLIKDNNQQYKFKNKIADITQSHLFSLIEYTIRTNNWLRLQNIIKLEGTNENIKHICNYYDVDYRKIFKQVTRRNVRFICYKLRAVFKMLRYYKEKHFAKLFENLIVPFDLVGLYKDLVKCTNIDTLLEYKPPKIIQYVLWQNKISVSNAIKLVNILPKNYTNHIITRLRTCDLHNQLRRIYDCIKNSLDDYRALKKKLDDFNCLSFNGNIKL